VVVAERAPLPIHPSFWSALGLRARDANVIVQKNFFHYRMFYAAISFKHVPVVTSGATSLAEVRDAAYVVPMVPKAMPADWRPSDPILRAPKKRPLDAATAPAEA
jgi:hypothetical protein